MTEPRDVGVVIDDMIDHIDYVLSKIGRLSLADFRADRDIRQSIERSMEIISEASRSLPPELQRIRPEIPWRQVADFGNVLRHTYHLVNANIVWRIATEDLIPLREALIAMRDQLNR